MSFSIIETDDFDAACTRDNLGRLWEMKGDMLKARENRERLPASMICGSFDVSGVS